jgi:hypothetical protein
MQSESLTSRNFHHLKDIDGWFRRHRFGIILNYPTGKCTSILEVATLKVFEQPIRAIIYKYALEIHSLVLLYDFQNIKFFRHE